MNPERCLRDDDLFAHFTMPKNGLAFSGSKIEAVELLREGNPTAFWGSSPA